MVAVPCGIVGARIYHVITDYQLYFGARPTPDRRAEDLARRARDLGCGRARRARRLPGRPPAQASPSRPCWTRSPRHRWSPRRSAGSATGSTRSCSAARPRCRGRWRSTRSYRPAGYEQFATFHPTFLYELVWYLASPLVLVLLDRQFRLGHGKVFALYVVLYTRRPVLDRGAADRHGQRDRRLPAEQLHLADRVRGRADLVRLAGPQPAGPGGGRRGPECRRLRPMRPQLDRPTRIGRDRRPAACGRPDAATERRRRRADVIRTEAPTAGRPGRCRRGSAD